MLQTVLMILLALAWVPAVVFGACYRATGHLPGFGECRFAPPRRSVFNDDVESRVSAPGLRASSSVNEPDVE
jgi:hypothetical protein